MSSSIVSLPLASSSEMMQALEEVSDFSQTDMGYAGQGPWVYRILHEPVLTTELARMSSAESRSFGVDVVSLQPCPPHISQSQDRYVAEEWNLPDGTWQFNGVFDGNSFEGA